MPEPAILHVCPHCERVFDSPSVCLESGQETVPTPMVVSSQQFKGLSGGAARDGTGGQG